MVLFKTRWNVNPVMPRTKHKASKWMLEAIGGVIASNR